MKKLMKKSIAFGISALLIVSTLYIFFSETFLFSPTQYIENGKANLTEVNFKEEKLIRLDGEWEFYPNELLKPNDIKLSNITPQTITVPKSWADEIDSSKEVEVGTYRLVVKVPKDDRYGIRVSSIRHANKVFINGEEGGIGNPTKNYDEFTSYEKKFNAFGTSENGEVEIVIQVAHRIHWNGGIAKTIYFGLSEDIITFSQRNQVFESLIVASYFILGCIFLFYTIQRRRILGDFYFSLFCFAQGMYTATQSEKVILLFFESISQSILLDIQFGFIHLSVLFLILLLYHTFKEIINKKIMIVIVSLLSITGIIYSMPNPIITWIYKSSAFAVMMIPVVSIATSLVYLIIIMMKAILREKQDAIMLLISFFAYSSYGLTVALEFLFDVDMGFWPNIVLLISTITIAYFISYRNEKAQRKINDLTQELIVHNKLKDELIVKIFQEMNEPLNKLNHFSRRLMEGVEGPMQAKQQEVVMQLNGTVQKMGHILTDFIDAAQSKGQTQFLFKPIFLTSYSDFVFEMAYFIKNPEKVKVINRIPHDLPPVKADEARLKQVLFNIIHNAIKYTEDGGVVIDAYKKENAICITITDTGIGVEQHELSKVFNPFYQIKNSFNKEAGLGIGLGVAKQYVEMMEGNIEIQSETKRGTKVKITLPIYQNEYTSLVPSLKDEEQIPTFIKGDKTETILLLDQDVANLRKMVKYLSEKGYTIFAYSEETDLENVIANNRIDLMIVDMNMPKQYILSLINEIREVYHLVELPILLLSRIERSDDLSDLFNGVNGVIRKPIIEEELMSHIHLSFAMKQAMARSVKQELSFYYAQITPHFLYNTLNSIIGLSYSDVEKTREALEQLAIYFRAKLDYQKQQSIVSLEEELELVQAYLTIEQLRFDTLNIVWDVGESIDIDLPSMTLQPLVENAIHHAFVDKTKDATLLISAKEMDDHVEIIIQDNGVGIPKEKQHQLLKGQSQRLGFLNPFEKIKLMQNSKFELYSEEGKGTKIVIILKKN